MEKIKQVHVLPKLGNNIPTTRSFDLWTFKGSHDIFALVNIFLGVD